MAALGAAIFILFNMNINCYQAQESRLWALGLLYLIRVLQQGHYVQLQEFVQSMILLCQDLDFLI